MIRMQHVGSTYICYPPPTDTDIDLLVLVSDMKSYIDAMCEDGFELGGSDVEIIASQFKSLTKGKLNIICTSDPIFYDRFVMAANMCKAANVQDKSKRIAIHQEMFK